MEKNDLEFNQVTYVMSENAKLTSEMSELCVRLSELKHKSLENVKTINDLMRPVLNEMRDQIVMLDTKPNNPYRSREIEFIKPFMFGNGKITHFKVMDRYQLFNKNTDLTLEYIKLVSIHNGRKVFEANIDDLTKDILDQVQLRLFISDVIDGLIEVVKSAREFKQRIDETTEDKEIAEFIKKFGADRVLKHIV